MSEHTSTAADPADTIEELKALIREAEEALGNSDEGDSDDIQALRERLRTVISDGEGTLRQITATLRRQAGRADDAIRAKPYQSLGLAVGVGVIAGLLLARYGGDN
jgi:ElaB/YqjD/DUF883 family membrane-anchored ribosome-binding protein